MKQVKHTSL